ncbi:hypothetical protein HDE_13529 [Halotydeus destructor]|nr:hypothetical protein HDE_13529 [Halotydeus destructor]
MENRDREHYSIFGNLDSIDRGAMYNGAAIGTPPRMSEEKAAVEREFDVFKTSRWPSSLEKAIDGLFGMSLVESRYRRERAQTDIRDYEKLIDFRREQPLSLPRRFDSKQDSFDSGIGVSPKGRPLTGMRPTVDLSEYKPKTSEGPKNVDPVRPVRLHEELAQLPHPPIFLKDYPCAYPPYYQPSIGQLYETDHGLLLALDDSMQWRLW